MNKKQITTDGNDKGIHPEFNISYGRIKDVLSFTDIYITVDNLKNSYLYYPEKVEPQYLPPDCKLLFQSFIKVVFQVCKAAKDREDHLVLFEGRYFRCCVMTTIKGIVIAGRQMPQDFTDLQLLNLGKVVTNELTHERLNNGGLVVICGSPGNGKTTTSSATIIKRLEKWGGMCITIEDPPEVPLDGRHGVGNCIQTQVKDEGFASSIKMSMRSYPTGQHAVMFVGEVRDPKTAVEVLKASIDGRLVITTLHADSVLSAIQRIASLASSEINDNAYDMMANSFRLAIHQKLKRINGKLSMNVECLVNTTACVNIIKNQKWMLMRNELEKQERSWKHGKKIAYHNNNSFD